jgi:hypothetical protein
MAYICENNFGRKYRSISYGASMQICRLFIVLSMFMAMPALALGPKAYLGPAEFYFGPAIPSVKDKFLQNNTLLPIEISSAEIEREWGKFLQSYASKKVEKKRPNPYSKETVLDIEYVADLNLEAARIWESLKICSGMSTSALRLHYYKNSIPGCTTEKERLYKLYANTKNWFMTSAREKRANFENLSAPLYHPLFSEVLLEMFVWSRVRLSVAVTKIYPAMLADNLEISNLIHSCDFTPDSPYHDCKALAEPLALYSFSRRLLSVSKYCNGDGLWPELSNYAFAEHWVFHQKGQINRPVEKYPDDMPMYSFERDGHLIQYVAKKREPNRHYGNSQYETMIDDKVRLLQVGTLWSPDDMRYIEQHYRDTMGTPSACEAQTTPTETYLNRKVEMGGFTRYNIEVGAGLDAYSDLYRQFEK